MMFSSFQYNNRFVMRYLHYQIEFVAGCFRSFFFESNTFGNHLGRCSCLPLERYRTLVVAWLHRTEPCSSQGAQMRFVHSCEQPAFSPEGG